MSNLIVDISNAPVLVMHIIFSNISFRGNIDNTELIQKVGAMFSCRKDFL